MSESATKILPADKRAAYAALVRQKAHRGEPSEPKNALNHSVNVNNPIIGTTSRGKPPARINSRQLAGILSDTVLVTAQEYARYESRKYAAYASKLISDTIDDMSMVLKVLRDAIPHTDALKMRPIVESYVAATSEMRRALGIVDDVSSSGPKSLVTIQCVGAVSVMPGEEDSRATEIPDLPVIE